MSGERSAVTVVDNPARHRFEVVVDGKVAFAEYRLGQGVITFTHTLVPDALEGKGVGSALARTALDAARARGLKVIAVCEFIAGFIARHAEYQDLLAA